MQFLSNSKVYMYKACIEHLALFNISTLILGFKKVNVLFDVTLLNYN